MIQHFQTLDEDSDSESDVEETFYDASSEKPDLIGHGPRCRARFDFDGEGPEDLVFEDGDVIKLLERVGPEWRRGELNGTVGLFPLSFVEVIEDLPAEGASSEESVVVKAMFDYEGEGDELSFQVIVLDLSLTIGIKHGFLCINICWAPREMFKPEPERRGFQPLPRGPADVNVSEKPV